MKKFVYIVSSIFLLSACSTVAYVEPVKPESLLDMSSERVSFSLESGQPVEELTDWINKDQPTHAEVHCASSSSSCTEAQDILTQFGVPFENKASESGDEVVLLYDRIFTRDCAGTGEASGCSVAANTLQMVVDPRQFLDPAMLDLQDAEKASSVFGKYQQK